MARKDAGRPGFFRRKTYIVDKPYQYGMIFTLLGAMMVTAFLIVSSYFVLPAAEIFEQLSGEQIRDIILKLNGSFFGITLTVAGMIMLLLSHRVAGPAMVLKRAVRGFLRHDYSERTKLRKKDYLQDLSALLSELGQHLELQDSARQDFVAAMQSSLDQQDLEGARSTLAEFAASQALPSEHEDQRVAEPAPDESAPAPVSVG